MESRLIELEAVDGLRLAAHRFRESIDGGDGAFLGVLQVSHGMGEHAGRYASSLRRLIAEGWIVYAHDHRGHGLTAGSSANFGDFGTDGAERAVDDLDRVRDHIADECPGLPVFLFGHSLGSMFAQAYARSRSRRIEGLVLSGTTVFPDRKGPYQRLVEWREAAGPQRTEVDWLSSDPAEVAAYIADPLCGFSRKPNSNASFARVSEGLDDPARLASIRSDLPVLILAGDQDPMGESLAQVRRLAALYGQAGLGDVDLRIYPGGRHAMLHEVVRDRVVDDMALWLSARLASRRRSGRGVSGRVGE